MSTERHLGGNCGSRRGAASPHWWVAAASGTVAHWRGSLLALSIQSPCTWPPLDITAYLVHDPVLGSAQLQIDINGVRLSTIYSSQPALCDLILHGARPRTTHASWEMVHQDQDYNV